MRKVSSALDATSSGSSHTPLKIEFYQHDLETFKKITFKIYERRKRIQIRMNDFHRLKFDLKSVNLSR